MIEVKARLIKEYNRIRQVRRKYKVFFVLILSGFSNHQVSAQFYDLPSKKLTSVETIVTYSLSWVDDTLNPGFVRQEDMFLLIGKDISQFMGVNFYTFQNMGRDYERAGKMQEFSQIPMDRFRTRITYSIYKNYPAGSLTYIDKVMPNIFLYEEKLYDFDWRLIPETAVIQGYNCQKASTHYGGRKWIAWYTIDLPYNDGPYKFGGLPGLIVKLVDEKVHYKFELVKLERPVDETFIELKEHDYVKTNRSDFLKAAENFRQDIIIQAKSAGIESNEVQQKMANKMKRRNNPIEY